MKFFPIDISVKCDDSEKAEYGIFGKMSDFSNNSGENVRAGVGGDGLERADEEVTLVAGSGGGKRRHGKDKNCPKN